MPDASSRFLVQKVFCGFGFWGIFFLLFFVGFFVFCGVGLDFLGRMVITGLHVPVCRAVGWGWVAGGLSSPEVRLG